jgi:hypothetical protein
VVIVGKLDVFYLHLITFLEASWQLFGMLLLEGLRLFIIPVLERSCQHSTDFIRKVLLKVERLGVNISTLLLHFASNWIIMLLKEVTPHCSVDAELNGKVTS